MTAPPDLTRLAERLAAQFARAGYTHPVAAAVAVACRGNTGLELDEFAAASAIDAAIVRACEAGSVPFGALPASLAAGHEGLDLLALADLDAQLASRRNVGNL